MPEIRDSLPAPAHPVVPPALAARLEALGIRESDLEETFVRSGGHGGQNVNKTATCVQLLHRPSGLRVKCQDSRQQGLNRVRARELLADKLAARRAAEAAAERARLAALRREKRVRSAAAKQRILADKAHQSARKSARRPVEWDD
jgi:protein subunit release factor B